MRFLLTLILVAWAMPAGAQISPQQGPFAVVDSTGKMLGGALDYHDNPSDPGGPSALAVFDTAYGGVLVSIFSAGPVQPDLMDTFKTGEVYFENSDCTGQAYWNDSIGRNAPLPLYGGPAIAVVGGNSVLYVSTGPKATTSVSSVLEKDEGTCSEFSNTADFYPVTQVADLGAEFTPPFYPVAVESQQSASVPMQIGWLLGGLLLGLGVKRAVGR